MVGDIVKKSDIKQIIIAFFVVFILSVSYLFFLYTYQLINNNEKESNNLDIKYNGVNKVEIKDSLPISDKLGKSLDISSVNDGIQGYLEFEIQNDSNKSINYEIYILRNVVNDEIDTRYIKLYLTDLNGNPLGDFHRSFLPTYYSLNYIDDMPEAKSLFKSTITRKTKEGFVLRAWVSDGYSYHSSENTFSFSIGVRAI